MSCGLVMGRAAHNEGDRPARKIASLADVGKRLPEEQESPVRLRGDAPQTLPGGPNGPRQGVRAPTGTGVSAGLARDERPPSKGPCLGRPNSWAVGTRGGYTDPVNRIADIAQVAERILGKDEAMGSSPVIGSRTNTEMSPSGRAPDCRSGLRGFDSRRLRQNPDGTTHPIKSRVFSRAGDARIAIARAHTSPLFFWRVAQW